MNFLITVVHSDQYWYQMFFISGIPDAKISYLVYTNSLTLVGLGLMVSDSIKPSRRRTIRCA